MPAIQDQLIYSPIPMTTPIFPRLVDKCRVTCLKWAPGRQDTFLVSHSSGHLYTYQVPPQKHLHLDQAFDLSALVVAAFVFVPVHFLSEIYLRFIFICTFFHVHLYLFVLLPVFSRQSWSAAPCHQSTSSRSRAMASPSVRLSRNRPGTQSLAAGTARPDL